jgi:hypothetical protein
LPCYYEAKALLLAPLRKFKYLIQNNLEATKAIYNIPSLILGVTSNAAQKLYYVWKFIILHNTGLGTFIE